MDFVRNPVLWEVTGVLAKRDEVWSLSDQDVIVSQLGRICQREVIRESGKDVDTWVLLVPTPSTQGDVFVSIRTDEGRKNLSVKKLVIDNFYLFAVGETYNRIEHNSGDKQDCRVGNLRPYMTNTKTSLRWRLEKEYKNKIKGMTLNRLEDEARTCL